MEMLLVLLVPFALLAGFAAGRLRDAHAGQIRKENAVMQCYMPHHGEVSPDCPVECLLTVLSLRCWNALARAYDAPFEAPRTVRDVIGLYQRGQLRKISGIGPRHLSEIEAGLVLAGLDLATHLRPAACADGTDSPRAGNPNPLSNEREICPDPD